ncbi:CsbD family protein [Lichenicoccus sp.]|uniref:CsbD family protein n=1 Tax=Lichenicoccus sp. TaxID=2781899 RepID=UPI003D1191DA
MVDTNRIQGAAEEAIGRVQDGAGGLLGDTASQVQGKARAAAGQAQGAYGEALDTVRDLAADQPLLALGVATGLGFILGAILARR